MNLGNDTSVQRATPAMLLEMWQSPLCQEFYQRDETRRRTFTREDLCPSGRYTIFNTCGPSCHPPAQEVTLIPRLNMAYLTVRKAGSTAIHDVLIKAFGINDTMCAGLPVPHGCGFNQCQTKGTLMRSTRCYRCTTQCLGHSAVQEIMGPQRPFVFTFVRDPVDRFYSTFNFLEYHTTRRMGAHVVDYAEHILHNITSKPCGPRNVHYQSQAMSLSSAMPDGTPWDSPWHGSGEADVPLDFIGRTTHLAEDFLHAIQLAQSRAGATSAPLDPSTLALIETTLKGNPKKPLVFGTKSTKAVSSTDDIETHRTPALDNQVRAVYAQDIACFATLPQGKLRHGPSVMTGSSSGTVRTPADEALKKAKVALIAAQREKAKELLAAADAAEITLTSEIDSVQPLRFT